MSGSILVVGATGTVGRHLVAALSGRGEPVRAVTRQPLPGGVESVAFDVRKPDTVEAALAGVDRLYLLLPGGQLDIEALLLPVVAAAARRGIKIVFQSVFGVDADEEIPYRKVERAIERSGAPFVILRPNWFADNFHSYWKAGIDHGVIAVPAGDGKTSFIDARDIAASAAAALATARFDGRAFNLTGPQALGYAEAAAILSAELGKPVLYQPVDDAAFVAALVGAGVPEAYARFLASIFAPVRAGWTAAVTPDVETLTGRAPLDLATYARDNRAALAG